MFFFFFFFLADTLGKPKVSSPKQESVCDVCTPERSETAMRERLQFDDPWVTDDPLAQQMEWSSQHWGRVAGEWPINKKEVKSVHADYSFERLRFERWDAQDRNLRGCSSIGRTFHDERALCKFIGWKEENREWEKPKIRRWESGEEGMSAGARNEDVDGKQTSGGPWGGLAGRWRAHPWGYGQEGQG